MKRLGMVALTTMAMAGVCAMGWAYAKGHGAMNTTQHVPWGLWVAFYIFFLGLSAGAFLLSSLVYVFGIKRFEAAGPVALVQALGCLILGGLLIVLDLGHPERGYKVLTSMNPTSIMGWMGVSYLVYVALVLAELYLALRPGFVRSAGGSWIALAATLGYRRVDEGALARDRAWLRVLGIMGIPVAIVVHGGVGSIFAVAKARPGWFSGLFPIVFIVSALASGGALVTFLLAAYSRLPQERKTALVRDLALLSFGILCFDFLLLASEALVTLYGNVPHESAGWKLILWGPYWWVFWFIQLGAGLIVPLVIFATPRLSRSLPWLGAAGLLMVTGVLGARLNLVIPAQFQPAFPQLPEAYHHARWAMGYSPSLTEWSVALGSIAIGLWLFVLAMRVLPLEEAV